MKIGKCAKGRKKHEWIHPLMDKGGPVENVYFIDDILACPWCRALKPEADLRKYLQKLAKDIAEGQRLRKQLRRTLRS